MAVLRTPDERFQGLEDYDFEPHYVTITDQRLGPLRMHYLDEGDPGAPAVLLLHGEPTWSYLFRHAVAPLVAAGRRVVAPDLVGFGRSDKPDSPGEFSYESHVRWLSGFVAATGLRDAVVVGHDWGGLLGLRLVRAMLETCGLAGEGCTFPVSE
jgi:haloalkane dehalogenase